MARIESEHIWDVIELKRPQHAFVGDTKDLERLSAIAARGIAQLLEYRDFFASRSNRGRVSNSFGSSPYEPALVQLIGRGRARDPIQWTAATPGFPSVKVVSYDYLFERARESDPIWLQCKRKRRVRSLIRPFVEYDEDELYRRDEPLKI